ncbi:MAG: hypothetical protein LBH44_14535 [Treponema sp.]|jgi:hypothetical protein|nr:hypothetical protein [Treponema sp.]
MDKERKEKENDYLGHRRQYDSKGNEHIDRFLSKIFSKVFNSEVVVIDGKKKLKPGFFKRTIIRAIIALAIFFGLHFMIVDYNGTRMLAFSPDQIREIHIYKKEIEATIIGNYRLETGYGEVVLNNFCKILVKGYSPTVIPQSSFEQGKAEHNFTMEEMEIPKNAGFNIDKDGRISLGYLRTSLKDITLIDSTHIISEHDLSFLMQSREWILDAYYPNFFLVKLEGESEYQRYESISFERDWGKFVFGRPFEEQD